MAAIRACANLLKSITASRAALVHSQRLGCYSYSTTATESNEKSEQTSTDSASSEAAPESHVSEREQTLTEEKEKLMNSIKEVEDKYKRALAETENVRQRMKKQADDAKIFGIQGFCKDLLEVADILGKATESIPKEEITNSNPHLKNLYEGLVMTDTQLHKVFTRHGLEQINPSAGEKFDPYVHEALFQQPSPDKEPGTVAVVSKIGYKLHSRTIRPALVGVISDAS
ncbi:grpE protein homolog 1, mitochondrial-like [Tubulanus polymorphus]|uniref:grpE protein homolog 1, mitochondrial-like n=1 Tax=Tubulanus polymorphus TaxID=672921 RepID=UPI003DA2FA35